MTPKWTDCKNLFNVYSNYKFFEFILYFFYVSFLGRAIINDFNNVARYIWE